jgi:hypothetical protein
MCAVRQQLARQRVPTLSDPVRRLERLRGMQYTDELRRHLPKLLLRHVQHQRCVQRHKHASGIRNSDYRLRLPVPQCVEWVHVRRMPGRV